MAGHSVRTTGMGRCCSSGSAAIESSRMTGGATAARIRPGTATKWTYADDLATLFEKLDLKDAIMVGHSTGAAKLLATWAGMARSV
jgi:pimeloyl-ACP methyl ester carboxylesterase